MYNGAKRGVNYAMGDKTSTPQKSSAKSTLTVPGAPAPVTFQDKNAQGMQKMSYLDPSSAGQATNAGKLQGLPGVDPRTPRFREGLSDTMLAAAPAMLPAAIAAPAATAGALVGGDIGVKVGGKVGGTLAEAAHEGAGPTGEDVGSTVGMLAGAHRGGVIGEQVGREATPQMPEVKTPLKDLTDVQREASDNVDSLAKDKEAAQKKLDAALKEHNKHIASHEQGIGSPEKVVNEAKKAQAAYDEAEAHHALAKERLDRVMAPPPPLPAGAVRVGAAPTPEVPTEDIKAAPAAKVEEAPKNYNATKDQWGTREKMAYDAAMEKRAAEGGKTRIEGTQNRRQAEAPVAEERRTGERRNAAGLRVDAEGNPTLSPDVEGHWQAGAFGEKPVEDSGAKAREANPEPTRAETKPVLPKEEPTGYAAKKEEVVPAGSEGREPATPAAEYHPEVRQRVFELGNEDLKALARAHGLNPDAPEYAFGKGVKRTEATATSSGRQQTGRAKLADDVTAQMSDDEKINIGRNARTMESEGTFKGQDVSNTSRAEQARKLFPRLNAEETTGGYGSKNTGVTKEAKDAALKSFNDKATRSNAGFDPSMLKDAAKVAAYHIEAGARSFADFSTKMVEDFGEGIRPYLKDLHTKASEEALGKETAKTSAKDTDHMQAAIKELGPDAKLSDITKRAQEMKDSHAQVAAHNENGGSTFHPTKGDLNGKPAFSVGGEPEFKSPGLKMTTDGKELTTAQRDEFANRHAVKEALDKHKDASIGTWYDKETDKTTTELVKTPTDRAEAIAMGQKNGEKAIYDLGKGEEIKTGGTGEGPATLEAHHWSNTPDLTETDPEKMGTGVRGAERARMNEPGFQKRTNFGTEGYKEPAVQGQKYHYVSDLEASKYYDVQKDADGIWQKGFEEGGATGAEKAVRDAGYHGYRSGNEVASFEKVPVRPHVEAKPEFSMVTDADGKPDRLEITHNGEPVGHLKIEEQVPGTWTIKDAAVKADAQGQGFGKAAHMQAFEEARRAGAKTVESDVSNSSKENGVWESLKRDYPEAITEENGQYSADLSKISEKPQSIGAASAAAMGADKSLNRRPNGTVIESTAAKKLTVHSPAGKSFGDDEHEASFTYGEGGEYKNKAAAMEAAKDMSKVELEDDPKWEGVRGITDEKTATTAKEAKEASQAAAQNVRDEEATKKNKVEIQKLQESLPELAQEHLTQQEKDGITTTATGKPRTVGTAKFLANLAKNTVQYAKDIAMQGAGARKWYSRSTGAFEAIEAEAPNYFKKGDRNTLINFLGSLAGDSPQQAVVSNLRETLSFWKEWVDAGRPDLSLDKWKKFGDIADAAWKEDGSPRVGGREKGASMHWDYAPKGDEWNTENLLLRNLTLPETKVPNMIKAINGEPMWPDLTKNAAFKVPSFRENLIKWLGGKSSGTKHVTNDSWQGLWGDVKKKDLTNPESYHPLSVITRAAAKELGWEPEEAQAAIWSFTQCLTEKGSEDPEVVRHYSEDYADLVGKDGDDEVRSLLEKLGVNHGDLDKRLARLEQKPEIDKNTSRGTPTTADSVRQLRSRIETARGKGAIPEPKSIQGSLFRENPAFEHKSNPGAGHTRTGPTELELIKAEEQAKADKLKAEGELNSPLKKLGSKETPYKDKDTLFNPEEFENESNLGKLGEKKKKSPYGKL